MSRKKPRKQIRLLRHWKQRFDKNAAFIFRRPLQYGPKRYQPGDPIPTELEDNPTKLRRFWESKVIELAEFEDPDVVTGRVIPDTLPEGVTVERGKGSWYLVVTPFDEHKVNGQKKLHKLLAELQEAQDKEEVEAVTAEAETAAEAEAAAEVEAAAAEAEAEREESDALDEPEDDAPDEPEDDAPDEPEDDAPDEKEDG